jgi:hypothetical protein
VLLWIKRAIRVMPTTIAIPQPNMEAPIASVAASPPLFAVSEYSQAGSHAGAHSSSAHKRGAAQRVRTKSDTVSFFNIINYACEVAPFRKSNQKFDLDQYQIGAGLFFKWLMGIVPLADPQTGWKR